ncbi:hypothetical protein HNO86_17730 [Pseudomonas sp. C1C7]|uniref:hypothetical protein n=1 Tax=Pseudomonas sp. C1C7 TaxID=2735272 RepID=UPI001586BBE0|nr:hypothetical protein [Pseudomonas sp. C1C7]NUT76883.1 hypothetical protein [Pseudomonas sp. C1C7]
MSVYEKKEKPGAALEKTLAVVEELSRCKPRGPSERRPSAMSLAKSFTDWSLVLSVALLTPPALMVFFVDPAAAYGWAKIIALAALIMSMVLAIASLVAPIVASGWLLYRWESVNHQNMKNDIIHEHAIADRLRSHGTPALEDAKCWLELKIKRMESRVTWFFGDKTAVLGLLATAYLFAKELGGIELMEKTMRAGPSLDELGGTALMLVAALIFGLSLGAIFNKHIAARYRYQVELIDLAKRDAAQ